jgi:hypothetical protein
MHLMPAAFPFSLRTIVQASKSRTQPATFRLAEPRRGFAYVQRVGTDTPVFWDVQFRFRTADAVRFQLWFLTVTQRGMQEFTLPIRTEFGTVDHVCRFLPDGLLDTTESGGSITYTARLMARAQVVPAEYLAAAETIIGLPDWDGWAEWLDIALPEMPDPAAVPTYVGPTLALDFTTQDYRAGAFLPTVPFASLITFTRASAATYFDSAGVLRTAASGEHRIDFDPVSLVCRGLLIEEQRTNLFANRSRSGALVITLDAGPALGPDLLPAHRMVPPAGPASFPARSYIGIPNATAAGVATDYALRGRFAAIGAAGYVLTLVWDANISGSSNLFATVNFNPTTGAFTSAVLQTGWSNIVAPTAVLNAQGMWEVTWVARFTQQTPQRTSVSAGMQIRDAAGNGSYTADGTTGVQFACVQIEVAGAPSSYIYTTTAQATRAADVATISGAAFTNFYRQDEGVFDVEVWRGAVASGTAQAALSFNDGTANNRLGVILEQTPNLRAVTLRNTAAAGLLFTPTTANQHVAGRNNIAYRYAANDLAIALNGGTVATNGTHTLATMSALNIGSQLNGSFLNGHVQRLLYVPSAAAADNATIQALSA